MYNAKSCNALEKPFYTPIEAALRWCNLIAHEADILIRVDGDAIPRVSAFPQWPCLRANAEKILDAILNDELPYGRDGKLVQPGEHVRKDRLTVRHHDLKAWMAKHYPDQTPPFLFDEIERTTHAKITVEAWQALQAERDALKVRVAKAEDWWEQEGKALKADRDGWQAKFERAEAGAKPSHLLAIAALLELLKAPVERTRPQGMNQEAIKAAILEQFPLRGLSDRNLQDIFAAANKAKADA
ncbi:hypothetical protein [Stutzerimonas nitrititolerans]|uniref:hypothetical protein n=1 Tax=Stutzerimonas nitrititolerans TaxID=2482751 RepID=UPI0028ABFD06|nr:hypothetical protein [Stutzerimonas nitrititolerans]